MKEPLSVCWRVRIHNYEVNNNVLLHAYWPVTAQYSNDGAFHCIYSSVYFMSSKMGHTCTVYVPLSYALMSLCLLLCWWLCITIVYIRLACVLSDNTLIPFLEGRNDCYRFNSFTDLSMSRPHRWLHRRTGCFGGTVAPEGASPLEPRARAAGEASQPLKAAGASQSPVCK